VPWKERDLSADDTEFGASRTILREAGALPLEDVVERSRKVEVDLPASFVLENQHSFVVDVEMLLYCC
jgi:hypothetical protein